MSGCWGLQAFRGLGVLVVTWSARACGSHKGLEVVIWLRTEYQLGVLGFWANIE